MSEVEETIRRLSSKKNVQGVVVVNQLGLMIRSTLEASLERTDVYEDKNQETRDYDLPRGRVLDDRDSDPR
ncbi:hypothetical protein BKA57DRAFT_290327 [Linnemannia elongata]|nr:hypothetical protein BKA57DRAFT_290327 [Linnemannia elongata]